MNYLIIGGSGFIGTNLAARLLGKKQSVVIYDNFLRRGSKINAAWLKKSYPQIKIVEGDIKSNSNELKKEVKKADVVFHLAAQVAVTTSVINPREDFEINALGTFNVLEAVRKAENFPIVLFSSTNKVYGEITEAKIIEDKLRYRYKNIPYGISEKQNLDFHSPYGCSKGSADQYVRDYDRIYGIPTIVFRQSCIYGPHQFGVEDQGWIAWFIIALLSGKPLTIYGNGKQVRDILNVNDLVTAYEMAVKNIKITKGQIYNIGGGPKNTLSLLELIRKLESLFDKNITYKIADWRPGDQQVYISDIRKAKKDFGWHPEISPTRGIRQLFEWVKTNRQLFK